MDMIQKNAKLKWSAKNANTTSFFSENSAEIPPTVRGREMSDG
jgi:hypothetical protein